MRIRSVMVVFVSLLGLFVGCDTNPTGPTFPTIPEGTKLPPANIGTKPAPDKSAEKVINNTLEG